jgi:hypothetical protein
LVASGTSTDFILANWPATRKAAFAAVFTDVFVTFIGQVLQVI